ncbi:uncharacterized protein FIBRA_03910 [Fibroporia radiculosa]|uniref:F-box domain-containing protein n=1 Tax=Fibroporia radiculosa TaxID=599839 RepID=J4GNR3_9APHY|nr:uncharacterized protein FIBRA_03910 [Fibroporia radiculosa]CCM01840.1 predicted protein [Fibroporia radiculosa]
MVSADNLNLDCLELIFAHLSVNDLVSVSLVSRSFLAGVIPRLYRTLLIRLNQTKRYPAIISPFATVLAHPNLARHVRHIDIRTVPAVKSTPRPDFLRDCSLTIALCLNLVSFTCTPNVLPSFLLDLQRKESLQHLRVNATLTPDQAHQLAQIRNLNSITLDTATPHTVDVLSRWSANLTATLTTLTLFAIQDLSECILESTLANLPKLTGLHVVNCMKIDHNIVLRLVSYTPRLESLSFTSWETTRPTPLLPVSASLRLLKHLSVDTRCELSPNATPSLWNAIIQLTRAWSCSLKSITLKLSDKVLIGDLFIKELLDTHGATLTHMALLNCALSLVSVRSICTRCVDLERFAINIPVKDLYSFADALAASKSLHTLSDIGDTHHSVHGQRIFVSKPDIYTIMEAVPKLQRIITDGRVWTAIRWPSKVSMNDQIKLHLERKKSPPNHWFMPPAGCNT